MDRCESTCSAVETTQCCKVVLGRQKTFSFPSEHQEPPYSSDISSNTPWELPVSLQHGQIFSSAMSWRVSVLQGCCWG